MFRPVDASAPILPAFGDALLLFGMATAVRLAFHGVPEALPIR